MRSLCYKLVNVGLNLTDLLARWAEYELAHTVVSLLIFFFGSGTLFSSSDENLNQFNTPTLYHLGLGTLFLKLESKDTSNMLKSLINEQCGTSNRNEKTTNNEADVAKKIHHV